MVDGGMFLLRNHEGVEAGWMRYEDAVAWSARQSGRGMEWPWLRSLEYLQGYNVQPKKFPKQLVHR